MHSCRRGTNLIEVAVVLVVIAILAAISIPSFNLFMDSVDERAAEASAQSFVDNAIALSSLDGHGYQSNPVNTADTTELDSALAQVASESGSDGSGNIVTYTNTEADGTGEISVRGERDTYCFTVTLSDATLASVTCAAAEPEAPAETQQPTISFAHDNTYTVVNQGLNLQISENGDDVTSLSAYLMVDGTPVARTLTVSSGTGTSEVYRATWLTSTLPAVNTTYTVFYSYTLAGVVYSDSRTRYVPEDITDNITSVAITDGGTTITITGSFADPTPVTDWDAYVACGAGSTLPFFAGSSTTPISPEAGSFTVPITSGAPGGTGTYRCQVLLYEGDVSLFGWPTFSYP